jgi:hypothetical protein
VDELRLLQARLSRLPEMGGMMDLAEQHLRMAEDAARAADNAESPAISDQWANRAIGHAIISIVYTLKDEEHQLTARIPAGFAGSVSVFPISEEPAEEVSPDQP